MRARLNVMTAACLWLVGCAHQTEPNREGFTRALDFSPPSVTSNVEGGYFDQTTQDVPCWANSLRFSMQINRLNPAPGGGWVSLAQVLLNPLAQESSVPQSPERQSIGIEIASISASNLLVAKMRKNIGGVTANNVFFTTPVTLGTAAEFMVNWNADGTVSATINGAERNAIHLDQSVSSVGLITSGAQAKFDRIQWGYLGTKNQAVAGCESVTVRPTPN